MTPTWAGWSCGPEPFGLDMARPHQVALARRLNEAAPAISDLERAVMQ
jgi:hypothetical protein